MESVMWNSTNDLSSTDKESGDPVHEIRNPRCGIQSKTGLDSPGPKAFPSRHKGSLQQGKIHLKKFTWRGASVVQCLALFGQNAPINVTRIQDQKICENQEQRPYPSLLRKYVHDKGEKFEEHSYLHDYSSVHVSPLSRARSLEVQWRVL